ncbi:MAG: DNA repair protein RadC [Lachnospiraceae bacterium]|nr:DNA repair protein RadC [Lachnospiraceae bacterium]
MEIKQIEERHRMKDMPVSERPYEKCERHGTSALSEAELLAIVLQTGTRRESAVELAQRILLQNPEQSLLGLAGMSYQELTALRGIGRVKAIKLMAILELAKRLSGMSFRKKPVFTEPGAIADYYMQKLRFLTVEQVHVLFFNTKCIFLGDKLLTVGTVNSSLLSPREIFIEAVKRNAVNIILVHNHPSGDPTASREDIAITSRIAQAGRLLEISLLDHIIIGDNRYFSFKESGCAPF